MAVIDTKLYKSDSEDELADLRARILAKDRRISFLEQENTELRQTVKTLQERLSQRFQRTVRSFSSDDFEGLRGQVVKIFLDRPEDSFSMDEIVAEFRRRYPNVPATNIPRRVCELAQADGKFGRRLLRNQGEGKIRYCLNLESVSNG